MFCNAPLHDYGISAVLNLVTPVYQAAAGIIAVVAGAGSKSNV